VEKGVGGAEMLYGVELQHFLTPGLQLYGKFFLVNPASSFNKFFIHYACPESPNRQGFSKSHSLKVLILLVF